MIKKAKIWLVGGGSGGHIVPVFEIYNKLKNEDCLEITIIGSGNSLERKYFDKISNYKTILVGKLNRRFTIRNLVEAVKLLAGLFQVLWLFLIDRPALIFSKGGFVSVPVIFWTKIFHTTYFIHESDIEMGLSNRYAASSAKKVFVGFPEDYYSGCRNLFHTGQIIRPDFLSSEETSSDRIFSFPKEKPVVLVTGGSQGSLNLNQAVKKAIPKLLNKYNVIHQTGMNDYSNLNDFWEKLGEKEKESYIVMEYLREDEQDLMAAAVRQADIVVARAGATTIEELAVNRKPMVLVPYKHAAGDHQSKNAKYLLDHKAALVLSDDELNESSLLQAIETGLNDGAGLGRRAYNLFPHDGLSVVVSAILGQIKDKKDKI